MINTQNEIKYCIAFGILKRLLDDGSLNRQEFDTAHRVIADRFGPEAVRRLP